MKQLEKEINVTSQRNMMKRYQMTPRRERKSNGIQRFCRTGKRTNTGFSS